MNTSLPSRFAAIGSLLIVLSGILNFVLGLSIDAWYYEPYINSDMGHVGVLAGILAVLSGLAIYYLVLPLYRINVFKYAVGSGIITIVLGHLGAIAGALYVGTAGLVCLYTAGIWMVIIGIRKVHRKKTDGHSEAESVTN
jgi:hypothetical protein